MIHKVEIILPTYKLREFEFELAKDEIYGLLPKSKIISISNSSITAETDDREYASKLINLSFASSIKKCCGELIPTKQYRLETMGKAGGTKRRNTRYHLHGLHQYKGKFYPQLGKALINIIGANSKNIILDPFCGCGTLLLEAALNNKNAVGLDINPIGHMIASAKISSFNFSSQIIKKMYVKFSNITTPAKEKSISYTENIDIVYLRSWIPEKNLCKILHLNKEINSFSGNHKLFLHSVLSEIIKQFSYQEPREQRVRRRKDIPPSNVYEVFASHLFAHLHQIECFKKALKQPSSSSVEAVMGDARKMPLASNSIDCVITSPPYATALPYIDSDRLSLYFLGFVDRKRIAQLEKTMIGSRELSKSEKNILEETFCDDNKNEVLPSEVIKLIKKIHTKNFKADVGFRRKNTASVLYRYFSNMTEVLYELNRVVKLEGKVALVVGDNLTYAGGELVKIPTSDFLNLIAIKAGFKIEKVLPMEVKNSYNIYSKNAIKTESISILTKVKNESSSYPK